MADAKITALGANTTPLGTDILPMVDDPSGTPATQKITIANLVPSFGAAFATVITNESTTSTSFTDLATTGPAVTVTIGVNGMAWLYIAANAQNNTANDYASIGFAVSGATTVAASTTKQTYFQAYTSNADARLTYGLLVTGLTPGSNTFTVKYRAIVGGTAAFQNREISVIPL